VRDDPASVKHVNLVLGRDLVEQMSRPKDGEALLGDEPAHGREDAGSGCAIESHRRLVEEEKARAMNERAGDLDPSRLSAGQRADFFVAPLGKARSGDEGRDVRAYLRPGKPVQRSMIGEILAQTQVEIERSALEHHAELGQGDRGGALEIVPEDANAAAAARIKARDDREERGLAGAVRSKESDEAALRHRQGYVGKRLARAEPVADLMRLERRWAGHHWADTTTPQG
jgi:hypothetical protein